MRPTRMTALVVAAVQLAALSACALAPGGSSAYHVTVYFTKALAFYPKSRVQVMGADIGTVDSVTPENGRVKVVASIDRDVPLPADAGAAIVPLTLIGERTLTFSPPWRPGRPKLADHAVIGTERTRVPVEVDQALKAFNTLLGAFDPTAANKSLHKGAESLRGNGAAFNAALHQTADLTQRIAGQDGRLLSVAENLHKIAGVAARRQDLLGTLISDFSQVTSDLSDERRQVEVLLTALASLVRHGDVLVKKYQGRLIEDLGRFAQVSLVVKGNADRLAQFLKSLTPVTYMLINATNHKDHALTIRLALDHTYREWLTAALKEPTFNSKVPCLPKPFSNCQ
jgi:phospholipid/cholesterol/gamma-HCH transport system substrate-binding protein